MNIIKKFILKLFEPEKIFDGLLDITPEDVRALGVEAIALDADNTSSFDRTTDPLPGAAEWVKLMKESGFELILLSNGKPERAGFLAGIYDIPFIALSCKPLPFGYMRAMLELGKKPDKILMIGDQLFTDVVGAKLLGIKTVYCKPAGPDAEQKLFFAVKRQIEKFTFWYMERAERKNENEY